MSALVRCSLIGLIFLVMASGVFGQDIPQGAASSLGLRGGFSWPLGDWARSRIEPSVNFFAMGVSFDADLELAIGKRWTVAISGGYASLNGKDWENYVASNGGQITVSAYAVHFALLLRSHVLLTRPDILRIEFGPALLLASGSETYQMRAYKYDFLTKPEFGVRGGIEYTRLLTDFIGVSLDAAVLVFPSGVEYVDGESRTVVSLPVTLGVRFLF